MLKGNPVPFQSSEPLVRCPADSVAEGGFGVTCPVWACQIADDKNKSLKKKKFFSHKATLYFKNPTL